MASPLEQLEAVKLQLQSSCHGISQLSAQHRDWQRSIESMLQIIEKEALQQHGTPSIKVVTPEQVDGADEHLAEGPGALQHSESGLPGGPTNSSSSTSNVFRNISKSILPQTSRSELYKRAKHLHSSSRISALHPMLQSRMMVHQCPAGPLRHVLREMLPKTEVEPDPSALGRARSCAANVVCSGWFESICAIIILLNVVVIGCEAQFTLQAGEQVESVFWFDGLELIFLCIYFAEACLRAFATGLSVLCDGWYVFDLLLIMMGTLALVIVPIANSNMDGWSKFLVMRSLRLLRLMRVFRMTRNFKIIWRLVFGFLTAWETILAAAAMLLTTIFLFSCFAVEFIAKDKELAQSQATQPVVAEYFMGIGRSMLTLMQFVTLDGLREIYWPLVMEKPWLGVYFFAALLVVSVGVLNILTACFVENAMDNAAITAEEEKAMLRQKVLGALPSLIALFKELDTDGSGLLTHEEVENVPLDILPPRVLDSVYVDSMRDIFDLLDVNECGFLTQMEFVEGLLNLCLSDTPVASMQNFKLLKIIHGQLTTLEQYLAPQDASDVVGV